MNRPIQKNTAGFACLLYATIKPRQKPGGLSSFEIRVMSKTPKKNMDMNIANSSTTTPTQKMGPTVPGIPRPLLTTQLLIQVGTYKATQQGSHLVGMGSELTILFCLKQRFW